MTIARYSGWLTAELFSFVMTLQLAKIDIKGLLDENRSVWLSMCQKHH